MTATTAKGILPETKGNDQPAPGQRKRKPLSRAHKAKLVSALEKWRASLSDEQRQALKERNRDAQQARWNAMSDREKRDRLAGVKAWQKEQRAKKLAAAKAKPAPKAGTTKGRRKAENRTERGESAVPALAPKRTRKAVAK